MQGRKLSCCKIHRCGNPKYIVAALPSSQNYKAIGNISISGGGGLSLSPPLCVEMGFYADISKCNIIINAHFHKILLVFESKGCLEKAKTTKS